MNILQLLAPIFGSSLRITCSMPTFDVTRYRISWTYNKTDHYYTEEFTDETLCEVSLKALESYIVEHAKEVHQKIVEQK